jgi:general stress protein 26
MQTTVSQLTPEQRKKIIEFLKAHPVGVLSTVDGDGNPNASAIYINVDDELSISFTTKRKTRKYENIARHNKIALVVYEAANQTSLEVSGSAEEVQDEETQRKIYRATLHAAERTGEDVVPPVAKIAAGEYVGFTIKADNIWLSEYGWGNNFANALKAASEEASTEDPL